MLKWPDHGSSTHAPGRAQLGVLAPARRCAIGNRHLRSRLPRRTIRPGGCARSRHERAFRTRPVMHRYTGWAAGRVCDRGARLAEWLGRLSTGNGTAIAGSGLGGGRLAAWHVLARSSVRRPARLPWPAAVWPGRADARAGSDGGSVMTARAFSGQCRTRQHPLRAHAVYRAAGRRGRPGRPAAPVTAARLLDGARSVVGHQTRYAAVGCHHGLHCLQPTR